MLIGCNIPVKFSISLTKEAEICFEYHEGDHMDYVTLYDLLLEFIRQNKVTYNFDGVYVDLLAFEKGDNRVRDAKKLVKMFNTLSDILEKEIEATEFYKQKIKKAE